MPALERQKRDWEELAALDWGWAILHSPGRGQEGWTLEEFFETGEGDVARVLEQAATLGLPERRERALDFGCGVGRLTRALSSRFAEVDGVDISEEMVERAGDLNADRPNCVFGVNVAPDLRQFETGSFDFVLSLIVLQHLPSRQDAARYIEEFVRVLRPGGLAIFQLPARIPPRHRLQPRRRCYSLLRRMGVSERWLFERARLHPIRMIALGEEAVRKTVERAGGRIALVHADDAAGAEIRSLHYYVGR